MIDIPYNFVGNVKYQNYTTIINRVKQFERYHVIGKDASNQFDIYIIELGIRGKPTLFLTSAMHGSEFQATMYSLKFMEDLRDDTFPDKFFRDTLLGNFHIVYIPVQNPYGWSKNTNPYAQFNNIARRNANGVDLNTDFYSFTQRESRLVAEQIKKYEPFAFLDMHMFQPEYDVAYGRKFILANGQKETDSVRDLWRESFEEYAGEDMTVWTNVLGDKSELS